MIRIVTNGSLRSEKELAEDIAELIKERKSHRLVMILGEFEIDTEDNADVYIRVCKT